MARSYRSRKRWFAELLSFRRMVCPVLVQWVVFPFWVATSLLPAFLASASAARLATTQLGREWLGLPIGLLVFGIVWPAMIVAGRIGMECLLVLFKVHERLEEMTALLREIDGESEQGDASL